MWTQLTEDVTWIAECYELGDIHMHLSIYLVQAGDKWILIDTGSYYHQDEVTQAIKDVTGGTGPDVIVFSNSTLEHTSNLARFHQEWGPFRIITSADMPGQIGMPGEESWKLGQTEPVAGRDFSFIRPPFTDVLYSMWILDEQSGTLFTAEAFGHLHNKEHCADTSESFPDGFVDRHLQQFYAQQIPWLEYVDPPRLRKGVAAKMDAHDVERIAPVHGNPVASDDLEEYLTQLEHVVEKIASEGNKYDEPVTY
jgi:flavorubredoxin